VHARSDQFPETKTVAPQRLNFRTKFLYGFGSIAYGVLTQVLTLLLFFYNQVVGLSAQAVSAALAISLVVDAIWDPVIGHVSDNLRSPWGRRHPFMYGSAIPIAASIVFLLNPPSVLDAAQKFLWLLAFVVGARLLISLYEMPSSALAPELAPDYHDRTTVLSYRWVLGVLGAAFFTSLGNFWFFRPTPAYPQGQLNPAAWGPMAWAAATIALVSIVVSAAGTHHYIPRLHRPPVRKVDFGNSLRDIVATLKNRNLGVALTAWLIAGLSFGLYGGLALYFYTFFWDLRASQIGVLALVNLVASLVGAFIAAGLSRAIGKKRACMGMFFACVAAIQAPILLRLLGAFPSNGSALLMPILIFVQLISGALTNGGFILSSSMVADITEDAQVKTGRRAEGLLMATNTFITKATTGVSALLPGLLLAYVGFPAHARAGSIDIGVVRHMAWVYLPITSTLSFLSIAAWGFYQIDKASHERHLATVAEAEAQSEIAAETAPDAVAASRIAG
jgi:Na+/melibiose symporter-like transporter